jgi:lactoylglutathione lyase
MHFASLVKGRRYAKIILQASFVQNRRRIRMNILWTTIAINDMDATIAFYEKVLQVKEVRRFPAGPGREIAMLGDGEAKLEVICDAGKPAEKINGVSMGYPVGDLDGKRAELEAMGFRPGPVISPQPGVRFCFLEDPNGINVQFVEEKR